MSVGYAFKPATASRYKIAPEAAGRILGDIAKKHGALTPRLVVDEARDKRHPLHHIFEWNDGVAAEKYREVQAQLFIRSVVIQVQDSTATPVRAFLHVSPSDIGEDGTVGEYRPVGQVMADPDLRQRVLRRALMDLQAWSRRYESLTELGFVHQAIKKASKKHEELVS